MAIGVRCQLGMQPRTPLYQLASNLTSLIGVVLITTAGVLWVLLLPSWWRGENLNPYIGILSNMALPLLFLAGLALIPLGIWLYHRKRRKLGDAGPFLPQGGELRRLAIFMAVTTFVNVLIGSQLLYSAVSYMESDSFCGKSCHVMAPEFTAYQHSPHSHVECTECHIGSGAPSFVKAKINGTRQLWGVMSNNYSRPIPAPVENLRPASATCEHCHSPQRFIGDVVRVTNEFASDEANTASTNVAVVHVGGQNWNGGAGIHGAHSKGQIDFVTTDRQRQVIPEVTFTDANGKITVYKTTDTTVKPDQIARGEHRRMDCLDCHNRPAHVLEVPERAVDLAIAQGRISSKLPFIKKQAIEVLRREYPDRETANSQIAATLASFYATKSADPTSLKSATEAVQTIYARNIFPEMKITWSTYPNNLGHNDFPGCFRCHDGNHTSGAGQTISNDCATCHNMLAVGEKDPKILTDLGMGTEF
jgi:hypothetical protein